MSDFTDFLLLLWRVVRFVLDCTLYAIATILLVFACLLPWRWLHIWNTMQQPDDYRCKCCMHFFYTLLDLFVLPLGLVGATMPTRTYAFFADSFLLLRKRGSNKEFNHELRWFWWCNFWLAILETLCLAWCIPSLVVPTRLVAFVRSLWVQREQLRWETLWKDDMKPMILHLWFCSPFMAFVEILGFLSAVLILVTMVRSCQTVRDLRDAWKDVDQDQRFWIFGIKVQAALLINGASVLIDVVFLPLLILLTLTMWRLPPVLKQLRRSFDWKARFAILTQSMCLLLDFILLLPLLVVLLTVYRARPVFAFFTERHAGKLGKDTDMADLAQDCCPTRFHRAVLKASGFLILDLFCVPLIMLTSVVTFYRIPILLNGLSPGLEFYRLVCSQSAETLIDIPFLFAGFILLCTVVRADLVLPAIICQRGVSAWDRRSVVGEQLLFLCCDLASLFPLLGVLATIYRVPSMCMKLKTRFSRPLTGEAEMQPVEVQVLPPRPFGYFGLRIVALKSPNLSGVSKVRVRVLGESFWAEVAKAQGQMIATIGQSVLPLALKDGRDIDCRSIQYGRDEAELNLQFNYKVHTGAVLEYLDSLPWNVEALLQLEAKSEMGRHVNLLTLASTMGALKDCIASETGSFPSEALAGEDRVVFLRGASNVVRRNAWWAVVGEEFVRVVIDLSHVLLALLLLAIPWRLVVALKLVTERLECRPARHAARTMAAVSLWERRCSKILAAAEQLSIGYAKAAVVPAETPQKPYMARGWGRRVRQESWEERVEGCIGCFCCLFCPCCPNYVDFDPFSEFQPCRDARQTARTRVDHNLNVLSAKMNVPKLYTGTTVKKWLHETIEACQPNGSVAWQGFLSELEQELVLRSESFFWLMLLSEVHLLFADRRIHPEQHTDLVETIRAKASRLVSTHADHRQRLLARFSTQHALAFRLSGWHLKSWTMGRAIIREQLLKGITDMIFLPGLLLLILTFYRLPQFLREVRGRCDMAWIKVLLVSEVQGLLSDMFVLLQLLLLSALLTCTVVKLPDFISGLRPSQGLRPNRNWALLILSELVVGLVELLLLLTVCKTYRVVVSAVLFAVLSPAAMLALALPQDCGQKVRFALASLVWLLLILGCLFTLGPVAQILAGGFLALSFVGMGFQQVEGWASRRSGGDWWSPAVRCTLPNALVLSAIGMEAVLLTYAADRWAAGRASGDEQQTDGQQAVGHMPEAWVITALVIAGVHLLLSALPLVSEDEERINVVTDPAWRAAVSILQDVLFPFVTLALAPEASDSWWQGLLLLYFVAISVLNGATWDEPVDQGALLDIQYFEVFLSGHRLLLTAAMLAAARSQRTLFIILASVLGIWTISSMLWGAASVPWVQVLRLAVCAGALAGVFVSFEAGCCAWAAAALLALLVGLVAYMRRRWQLAATEVPAAMTRLAHIQARLSLWGDLDGHSSAAPGSLAVSPQGIAHQLMELEAHVPFERLRLAFLQHRRAWHHRLLQAPSYEVVLGCLEELEQAVMVPPAREQLLQLLRKVPLPGRRAMPRPLVAEIVSFLDSGKSKWLPEIKVPSPSITLQDAYLDLEGARVCASRAADQIIPKEDFRRPSGAKRFPKAKAKRKQRPDRVHPESVGHPVELERPPELERMTE